MHLISKATLGRLPTYLKYLQSLPPHHTEISATSIARELSLGEVQVRKDLASVCGNGKPKIGYRVSELTDGIENVLSERAPREAIIVGAGKLGRALLDYSGFGEYGLDVAAAFDISVKLPEKSQSGKPILPMSELSRFCREHDVGIGIITVPAAAAQKVCDELVKCRVRGIWCFAPTVLSLPAGISVQYENMALSLAYLNKKI